MNGANAKDDGSNYQSDITSYGRFCIVLNGRSVGTYCLRMTSVIMTVGF